VIAAAAYAVEAVALAILLVATGSSAGAPVVAVLRAGDSAREIVIATVEFGMALVAVLAGAAVVHAVAAGRTRSGGESGLDPARRWLVAGWSQGAAILVFLVAQANGIHELTSLVPMYALASVAVVLSGIDRGDGPTWRRPGAWAAVAGIVPWGVIAFAQIGAGAAVGEVPLVVRVVTLAALALVILGWLFAWRRMPVTSGRALVTMTAGLSAVVWLAAALIVLL
jgi:hypothetical protein